MSEGVSNAAYAPSIVLVLGRLIGEPEFASFDRELGGYGAAFGLRAEEQRGSGAAL